jgi:asparagine synthase (glutamine-hydrolysing)
MADDSCIQFSRQLHLLLTDAVSSCFASSDSPGVLFSGGLDSSVITAILSKAHPKPIQLFVAGIESAKDIELAHETADALNISLVLRVFTEQDVKESLPTITSILGTSDVLQTELAIPFFFAANCAKQFGVSTLFCGQGADELFGGYAKYEKLLLHSTEESVLVQMKSDLHTLQTETLPRLQRIVSSVESQLIAPFLETSIINFSFSLPFSCKLHKSHKMIIRKNVLRLLAEELGLPSLVVNAPKRAMQYGSGVHRVLTKLAADYWLEQNPELTKKEARTHARVEQYLSQIATKTQRV